MLFYKKVEEKRQANESKMLIKLLCARQKIYRLESKLGKKRGQNKKTTEKGLNLEFPIQKERVF